MPTGALPESRADMLLTGVVALLLLAHHGLSAPQLAAGSQREASADAPPTLVNPFGPGEDSRRLLQSYIKANVKKDQGGPEINTWEQEVFFLFSLHDYDRSGHMDGLEMMKFIADFNSHNSPGTQSADTVVSMVDFLLQTQDVNQDGLFAPSELLSPPKPQGNSDSHDAPPQQEQKAGVSSEGKSSQPGSPEPPQQGGEQEVAVEAEQEKDGQQQKDRQEAQQQTPGEHPAHEDQPQQTEEQKGPQIPEAPAGQQVPEAPAGQQVPEAPAGQQVPEAPAAVQDHSKQAPVHQGQPEM